MTSLYVILDRDGVINEDSADFIKSAEEWQPVPGSLDAIALLHRHGYQIVVITNQSGVARGLFDLETLGEIHAKMLELVRQAGGDVLKIYFCPHGPDNDCDCRKPKAGLFRQFAQDYNVDLRQVFAVGDSLRDAQAATLVGAKPILVKTGKGLQTLENNPQLQIPVFESLYGAASYITASK